MLGRLWDVGPRPGLPLIPTSAAHELMSGSLPLPLHTDDLCPMPLLCRSKEARVPPCGPGELWSEDSILGWIPANAEGTARSKERVDARFMQYEPTDVPE